MALPRGFGQKLKEFRASGLSPGDAMRRTWAHFRRKGGNGRERMLDVQRKRAATRRGNPGKGSVEFVMSRGTKRVRVETARGHVDWPIQYVDGHIAYDSPERVPEHLKRQVERLFRSRRNPGAAWHQDQAKLAEDMERRETRPRRRTYLKGMADAHSLSAHESRKRGMNPRPSAITAHKLAAANRLLNLVPNAKQRHHGFAYLAWLKGGAVGNSPEPPAGLSVRAARMIELELEAMDLWSNPQGGRTVVGRVFRAKRWAQRWARGRPIRRVKGGWAVQAGRKRPVKSGRVTRAKMADQFERAMTGATRLQRRIEKNPRPPTVRELVTMLEYAVKYLEHPDVQAIPFAHPASAVAQRMRHIIAGAKGRVQRNPIAVYNPPQGRMIYSRVLSVEADTRPDGIAPGDGYKGFRHDFPKSSQVAAYALPDGSVLLKSGKGLRLWKDIP